MKKITLLFLSVVAFANIGIAQDTCANATAITAGTFNVTAVDGTEGTTVMCSGGTAAAAAEWYTYTPTADGSATISSNILPTNANGDTRINIYTGNCGALVCVADNDDIDYTSGNYLSEVTFNTTANTTYYVVWDNRWSSFGFEFTLVEATGVCIEPTDFTQDDFSSTTFDLSWTDTNAGSPNCEIEYGAPGFVLGTGTLVSNIAVTNYQFTSLTENTTYNFFIRTNCDGGNDDSNWVGPISFRSSVDCSNDVTLPYSENFADASSLDCLVLENTDNISPVWSRNTDTNDLDGDGTNDSFMAVFPQLATEIVKKDWLFSPRITMTTTNSYNIDVLYNAFDLNSTADESYELYITDSQSSTATFQSLLGTYNNITQSGVFGDTSGNDLITQAYSASQIFTPTTDGTYYVALRATTTNSANLLMLLNLAVTSQTLSVENFESSDFIYYTNSETNTLTLKADTNINSYTLYNSIGQEVLNSQLSSKIHQVNLDYFNSGIYFVNVNIGDTTKTIKIAVK